MIKYHEFTYNEQPRKVYAMVGKNGYLEGIDLSHLSEEEQKAFEKVVEEFHKKLEPFMKAYRRFSFEKISS